MMSEGDLCEPINPDYQPPKAEIVYEVEYRDDVGGLKDAGWLKHKFVRSTFTDDLGFATRTAQHYRTMLYKARVIRVETVRSQLPS